MKKGPKRTFVLGTAFAVAASIAGCVRKLYGPPPEGYDSTPTATESVKTPKKTIELETAGLEYQLQDIVDENDFAGHDRIDGVYGAKVYLGSAYQALITDEGMKRYPDGPYISYSITHYPDYSDSEWAVTCIVIRDPKASVFGLTLNSEASEFDETLTKRGFSIEWIGDTAHRARFDDITIAYGNGEIRITADVTNNMGIVY